MSDDRTPEDRDVTDASATGPGRLPDEDRRRTGDDPPEDPAPDAGRDGHGPLAAWRRTYGASPLHLLLHLAAIALMAWALSQAFDARYEQAYLNLALWMVGGAILNDFVALPLYVGIDRAARAAWGLVRPAPRAPNAAMALTDGDPDRGEHASGADGAAHGADRRPQGPGDHALDHRARISDHRAHGPRHPGTAVAAPGAPLPTTSRVRGNGHVRTPLAMSAVLLLVYFPNITHKAPIGHRLSTGLAEQPDWAGRWLAITAGLLLASAAVYAVRLALAGRRARAAA